jgi:hypothetical protein
MATKVTRSRKSKSGGQPAVAPCECCGFAPGADGKPLSVTFEQPDVYYDIPDELLDTWGQDPFLAIKTIGFFLRVIVPVRMDGGFSVNFGTWLEIDAEDFRTAWQTWNMPEYQDLEIEGYLANELEPWGPFPHALVKATVRDLNEVPVVTSATDPEVQKFLETEWRHNWALPAYAETLKVEMPETVPPAGAKAN